ncbi:hypothetical protein PQJ75_30015 [Rhodoplanes sp. TEM]|uniref:Uncharacterized protein n=1 Tax=Rhodoplanes tepidamans TaxID=200616 RepID=A0ABT5JA33_RHOTP|nr:MULTISPECIES: hypothetical protein [Rhodoplanes]MDC7785915.1 hypothetical protein [Rhodoplanes tepidamans]MDC7987990.1 hypothetical protein [Rhodoplanes sp. TEM]MDQ0355467.1 hypothetical protein [Rhodoplanes tepidamans]
MATLQPADDLVDHEIEKRAREAGPVLRPAVVATAIDLAGRCDGVGPIGPGSRLAPPDRTAAVVQLRHVGLLPHVTGARSGHAPLRDATIVRIGRVPPGSQPNHPGDRSIGEV